MTETVTLSDTWRHRGPSAATHRPIRRFAKIDCPFATLGLSGSSGKSPDAGDGGDPRLTSRLMAPSPTPDERVPVLVPVGRRLLDRATDLLPRLESPTFQR